MHSRLPNARVEEQILVLSIACFGFDAAIGHFGG
jgi:hypothetical protein